MLINNQEIVKKIQSDLPEVKKVLQDEMIKEPFYKDFMYRFCWSSNSIEGNTLSLDETIEVLEYDEVRSGHTYTEYMEAKNLFRAIQEMLRWDKQDLSEEWIKTTNGIILGEPGEYRKKNLYIGTLVEAIYYPPDHTLVAEKMSEYIQEINSILPEDEKMVEKVATEHILFERIHPFRDGNGRTGRMILNQRLINHGWLPVTFEEQSKYRQAFRRYDRSGDVSQMVHLICKAECSAIERVRSLDLNLKEKQKDEKGLSGNR